MDLTRAPLRENIELKARLEDPAAALLVCRKLGAAESGRLEQTDTYFSLGRYRLKLREGSDGEASLIGYSRPDDASARKSQYRIHPVKDLAGTKAALTRQWGVKVVVRKSRRLFLWRGRVRIHLDRVESLGDFLEFEALVGAQPSYDEDAAREDVAQLTREFGLRQQDLVAQSYSSMVAALGTPA